MGIDVGGDLGLQRSREHRPCTVTHDLVEQRPARRAVIAGHIRVVDYLEHAAYLPEPARHRRLLIRTTWTFRSSSRRCAHPRHQAEDHPQVLIIAPSELAAALVTSSHPRRTAPPVGTAIGTRNL